MGDNYFEDADVAWRRSSAEAAAHYESKAALRVASALGVDASALLRAQGGERPEMSFSLLDAAVPLPARFVVGKLRRLYDVSLTDLFGGPQRTPPYRAYVDLRQEFDNSRPLVMVFSWSGVSEYTCVHDMAVARGESLQLLGPRGGKPKRRTFSHVRVLLTLGGMDLTLEALDDLLAAVVPR